MSANWLKTRTTLIKALGNPEDAASWEYFVDTYGRVIFAVAMKAGLAVEDARDVTQETLSSVAARVAAFDPDPHRGSFKSWLLAIARSRIADCFRRRKRQPVTLSPPSATDDTQTGWIERQPDPNPAQFEELCDRQWKQTIYEVARERVRTTANPKHYRIFDLHVLHEWPVAKVAAELNVTPNQVYVAKHRIGEAIVREAARLERGETDPDSTR